jgi:hypothetical protein
VDEHLTVRFSPENPTLAVLTGPATHIATIQVPLQ